MAKPDTVVYFHCSESIWTTECPAMFKSVFGTSCLHYKKSLCTNGNKNKFKVFYCTLEIHKKSPISMKYYL